MSIDENLTQIPLSLSLKLLDVVKSTLSLGEAGTNLVEGVTSSSLLLGTSATYLAGDIVRAIRENVITSEMSVYGIKTGGRAAKAYALYCKEGGTSLPFWGQTIAAGCAGTSLGLTCAAYIAERTTPRLAVPLYALSQAFSVASDVTDKTVSMKTIFF